MTLLKGRNTTIQLGPAAYALVTPGTSALLNLCNVSAGAELNDSITTKEVDVYCTERPIVQIMGRKYDIKFKVFVDRTQGRVTSATVTAGGTGYTTVPTVVFTGGGGTGAAGVAITNNGAVVGVIITNNGTGYTSAPTISFTGGGGTGAAATAVINQLNDRQFIKMLKDYEYLTWYFYPDGNATGKEGYSGTIALSKLSIKMAESDFVTMDVEGIGNGDWSLVTAP